MKELTGKKRGILAKIQEVATMLMSDEEKVELKDETVKPEVKKPEVKAPEKKDDKVKLAQQKLDNGTVLEAESFEAGQPVFIVNEDERVPLPVGEYEFEGKMLVVSEEGVIGEVKDKAAEEPEKKVEAEAEFVTKEEFNKAIDDIKGMLSSHKDKEAEKLKAATDKTVELQAKLDEKPDAELLNTAPVELSKEEPKTKEGRIMRAIRNAG